MPCIINIEIFLRHQCHHTDDPIHDIYLSRSFSILSRCHSGISQIVFGIVRTASSCTASSRTIDLDGPTQLSRYQCDHLMPDVNVCISVLRSRMEICFGTYIFLLASVARLCIVQCITIHIHLSDSVPLGRSLGRYSLFVLPSSQDFPILVSYMSLFSLHDVRFFFEHSIIHRADVTRSYEHGLKSVGDRWTSGSTRGLGVSGRRQMLFAPRSGLWVLDSSMMRGSGWQLMAPEGLILKPSTFI